MALEGTLRDFSFADILQLISLQRKTGVLTLKNEGNVVTISFMDGKIVAASALNQQSEDRLGIILLKQGALNETELEAALRRQEETLQRLGRILIDHNIVPIDVVRRALEQQILQIVYRVFRWTDGDYQFSQETEIDYDRDLMLPMAVDSIIMEGARMTDEWPFIDQRIPNRNAVYRKVDPSRTLEVVEEEHELEGLGFTFADTPDDALKKAAGGRRVSENQMTAYRLVNGQDSVEEIVLRSNLLEFETFKALAELLDRGLIREATPEEVVGELSREQTPARRPGIPWGSVPWLALPFLVLLGLSLSMMLQNPLNPVFAGSTGVWERFVESTSSWFRLEHLADEVEGVYYLRGTYPRSMQDLIASAAVTPADTIDPWGRPYRLMMRGNEFLLTGSDAAGQPLPLLLLSRDLVWERVDDEASGRPGLVLVE